jgi:sensor histidine kinase regulating citrate/malate metabolism
VINQLTHDAVMRSQNGGELKIRLYTKNEDIFFEVEDAPPLDKATPLTSAEIEKSAEGMIHTPILNQLLCQKIIDEYDGSIGVHHENSGDVHFFKIPKKTFYLGEIYH